MKKISCFFISIFLIHHVHAQDSLGNITELQKLLKDRQDRFEEYAKSADQRSGIFGTKTKKDLEQSREVLLQIVKTDNNILDALSHAIAKRGIAKADYSYDQIESKQTIDRLTLAADTLNKQLIAMKEINASLEKKAGMQKVISYLLTGSGRRTYVDVITKPFISKSSPFYGSGYYFYDMNAKINYRFSDNDHVYLSGYFGRDVFTFKNSDITLSIPWGNATTTLRWNHLFSNKLFMNASAIYNSYNFKLDITQQVFQVLIVSGVHDFNGKVDFDFSPSVKHHIKYGLNYTYHIFQPQSVSGRSDTVVFTSPVVKKYGHEGALYAQDQWDVTEKIQLSAGLRFSMFNAVGPATRFIYDSFTGKPIDSLKYKTGETIKTYSAWEPRLLIRYSINELSSLKASFTINDQYVHLVAQNGTTLPTDIWVPSSFRVKPQVAYQYSLGYFRNFSENAFETSVEIYYKQLFNQIEFKEGYTPQANEDLEQNFVFGTGDSYGLELYVNKKTGRLNGWIGYTLSYTNRHFPDLNDGKTFPYRYDRRHNLSVVATYQLTEKWSLGAEFVYNTGIAYTLPVSKYFLEGSLITEYGPVNSYRLASYNRLDISATKSNNKKKKLKSSWNFSVYNVYSRKNPFFIYNAYDGIFLQDPQVTITAKQVSLFPIIPSVTWNFSF